MNTNTPSIKRKSAFHRSIARGPILLLFVGLIIGGCGDPQEVIQSGTTGTNGQVGDVLLRNVYVDEPSGLAYEPGADPRVILTLVNQGGRPDTLRQVTTPVARAAQIRWDRDCDGAAEVLPELSLPARLDLPSPPNGPGPLQSGYYLRLLDLTQEVLPGTTIPLTFTFTHAGAITLQAKVGLPDTGRAEPDSACTPARTPTGG